MIINWLGMSCFKIQTKEATLLLDPYQDNCGLKMPKLKTDLIVLSDSENNLTNNTERLSGDGFLVNKPGEYESKQIFISGISAGEADQANNNLYYLEIEDLTIGFLGLINHSLSNKQLELLEGVDILFLPIGSLTPEKRSKIISQIEPRIIIPMYYAIPKIKPQLESLDKFLKELGVKDKEMLEKYKISKKELPQEETKIILLNPTN